jgi:hypothetical protein
MPRTLEIPGVDTVHPREVWEPNGVDNWFGTWYLNTYGDLRRASAFHRQPPALDIEQVEYVATHYTSAIDLPDGDPGEILDGIDGIRALLARSHYDYLVNRTGGGYTRNADGRRFPGYPLGYSFAIDWMGGVWEINGWDFRPAATNHWNEEALAFLMLTDRADPASEAMWRSHRMLSREALRRGARIAPERVWAHGWFAERTGTGTSTACCGPAVKAQIVAGHGDWTKHDQPNPTPDPEEPDMSKVRFCKVPGDTALYVRTGATTVEHVRAPADIVRWEQTGLVENDILTPDDLRPLLPVLTLVGPAPFYAADDPTPTETRTRAESFYRQVA